MPGAHLHRILCGYGGISSHIYSLLWLFTILHRAFGLTKAAYFQPLFSALRNTPACAQRPSDSRSASRLPRPKENFPKDLAPDDLRYNPYTE